MVHNAQFWLMLIHKYLHSLERFSIDEHLEKIDIIRTYKKQQQAEIVYAIESHKCPRCGAPILQKK